MPDGEDPFGLLSEGPGFLTHPEFKRCTSCQEYLVWDVWTSEGNVKCKAWRCPTKSRGHIVEFV